MTSDLMRRIVDRDPAALGELHGLLSDEIAGRVIAGRGDPIIARSVTRAVFMEAWRLVPVTGERHHDTCAWLTAIAEQRRAEQRRAPRQPSALALIYDEHTDLGLSALLGADRQAAAAVTTVS